MIVAIRLHNQQSNNFHEGQQQNAKWSGLTHCMCSFPAFPVGSPNKGVNYTPSRLRGQCPRGGLWLLTCHITNIILVFRAPGKKIWARRVWYWRLSWRWAWLVVHRVLRSVIFLLVTVWIHYDFLYLIWDSRRACFTREILCSIDDNLSATAGWNSRLSADISCNFCKTFGENAFPPT